MAFPNSPSVNDTTQVGDRTYRWNGSAWETDSSVIPLVGPIGATGSDGPVGSQGEEYTVKVFTATIPKATDIYPIYQTPVQYSGFTFDTNDYTEAELEVDYTNGTFTIKESGVYLVSISANWALVATGFRTEMFSRMFVNDGEFGVPCKSHHRLAGDDETGTGNRAADSTSTYFVFEANDVITFKYEQMANITAQMTLKEFVVDIIRLYKS